MRYHSLLGNLLTLAVNSVFLAAPVQANPERPQPDLLFDTLLAKYRDEKIILGENPSVP